MSIVEEIDQWIGASVPTVPAAIPGRCKQMAEEIKTAAPSTAVAADAAEGKFKDAIAQKLGELLTIPEVRKKYGVSLRLARKMVSRALEEKPDLYEDACKAAGIDTKKIGNGGFINWIQNLDPAKVAAFIEKVMQIIAVIAPLFV